MDLAKHSSGGLHSGGLLWESTVSGSTLWSVCVCALHVCSGLDDDHGDADDDHDEGIVPLHYLVYYVYMLLCLCMERYYISAIYYALSHLLIYVIPFLFFIFSFLQTGSIVEGHVIWNW